MTMFGHIYRLALPGAAAIVFISTAIGCGGDPDEVAGSGGSLAAPADPRSIDTAGNGGENRPPKIHSIRLDPREPIPGRPVRATVTARDADGDPVEIAYSWQINGREIDGKGPEIILGELDRQDVVSVRAVASDGRGQSEPMTAKGRVGNRPPRILDIQIHTRGKEGGEGGEWVVEPTVEDPDDDLIEFDYEWRLGRKVVGEEQSLTRSGWTRGDRIVVTVIARDRDDASSPLESAPIVIGNSAPEITSKPPGLDRSGSFRYQVSAKDPDGDRGLRYSLGEAPEDMEIDSFGGLVTWKATTDHEGEHKVEVIVDDRKGSTTKQVFFLAVRTSGSSSPASIR